MLLLRYTRQCHPRARLLRSIQTSSSSSKFDWASLALSSVSKHAAAFEQQEKEQQANNIYPAEHRHRRGLEAAWKAWCDVSTLYYDTVADNKMSPCHSKCVGFTSDSDYYSVYLMDKKSLVEHGIYDYGTTPVLGWPNMNGKLCAYDPDSLESTELNVLYQWVGEYDVQKRPWFLHGRTLDQKVKSEWTPPYTDPVKTNDLIVSCVRSLPNDNVAIAGTWLVPSYRMLDP